MRKIENPHVVYPVMMVIVFTGGTLLGHLQPKDFHLEDSQVARGNWDIEIQIPPCGSGDKLPNPAHTIQVLQPERDGDVLTISCTDMPVNTR